LNESRTKKEKIQQQKERDAREREKIMILFIIFDKLLI